MKFIDRPLEIKALGEDGIFSGFASLWNEKDLGDDIVRPMAFKEIVKNEDGNVVFLWQHGARDPIGTVSVEQTDVGLKFSGQLVMEDATARKAYAHMKAKTVRGASIGYDVLPGGSRIRDDGVRELTALKLWEISAVTFPMLLSARIDAVKSCPQFDTIRDCEVWLREEQGFTNSAAKEFIARFKKALVREEPTRDESEAKAVESNFLQYLNSLHKETT